MSTVKNTAGTSTTILSTELSSLPNNTMSSASAAITLSTGEPGYRFADAELVVTFNVAPTALTSILVWFLQAIDGTNYDDGSSSLTPAKVPDIVFPVRAVTTQQRITVRGIELPPGTFKAIAKNDGTTQTTASSGNTIKIRPYTETF